jgi:hypothetical protein
MSQQHLPIERAKAAVRANPSASVSDITKAANVSRATAQRAQKLVAVKPKPSAPASKPKPHSEPQEKVTDDARLAEANRCCWALDHLTIACRFAKLNKLSDDEIVAMLRTVLSERQY